ncbi:hypothetical protein OG589_14365 [Sphaerisporangium sp. NBC_01403]|uniref:hypothetical protein n=1 Tax=Sphaerisporangium sp. NBC_01403 TaxID=2903599 RepID=UPI0032502CFE
METYKGHTYIGLDHTLGGLRAALNQLTDLPDDTPIRRADDDANDPDSYALIDELEVAFWDGEVQCEEGDEGARKALFI